MNMRKKVDDKLLWELGEFHGAMVPGLLIGAFMVEMAFDHLEDAEFVDAVVETKKCVTDAVQYMTGCTVGNGWLTVYDWGRFALTLYDKRKKKGVRVKFDPEMLPKESIIFKWFFREAGKESHDEVNREVMRLGKSILAQEPVNVTPKKKQRNRIFICEKCREAFPGDKEGLCRVCADGPVYFERI